MNKDAFTPFPELKTARLTLRQLRPEDADFIYCFNADLKTIEHIPRDPYSSLQQAHERLEFFEKAYKDCSALWWMAEAQGKVLGYCGLFNIDAAANKAEIGYGLCPPAWGQGYATELIAELTRFGFQQLQLNRIYGLVSPSNKGSFRVLEKNGYACEGVLRQEFFARERYFDIAVIAKLRENAI